MKKLKVGVIGLGLIGSVHLEALRRIDFIEVVAVSESNLEKANQARLSGIPRVYEKWEDLIADPEVEVVHNCTPNHLHFPINQACLAAKKGLLSEKPLGLNSEETAILDKQAKQMGLPAGINFCYRYYPAVQWAKHLIITGYLGEIRMIHGRYLQDWLMFDTDYNWRVEENQGGKARALGDIGSHWCDLAQYLSGLEIREVMADYATIIPERKRSINEVATFTQGITAADSVKVDTDDWASVLLRFSKAVSGNFYVSQVSAGHKNGLEIEIDGSLRSLSWKQENPEHLWIGERGGSNHLLYKDPSVLPASVKEYAHFPAGHG
jgi:predicted dehydrogenase